MGMAGRAVRKSSADRSREWRARQRARGLRPVTLWLPDTRTPEFRAEARRQSRPVAASPEEDEISDYIEAVADWPYDE
jgi:hypothetical protein